MHENEAVFCDFCGLREQKSSIKGHIVNYHDGEESCTFCGKVFSNHIKRITHENVIWKKSTLHVKLVESTLSFKYKRSYWNHRKKCIL